MCEGARETQLHEVPPSAKPQVEHTPCVLQGQGRWRVLKQLHIQAAQSGWDSCDGKGEGCFFQLPFVSDCFTQEQALLCSHLLGCAAPVRGASPLKGFPKA